MSNAFIKKADTDAEQARGVAEELGHIFHADVQGFFVTPQDLADIIKRNATYTDEALAQVTVTVTWPDGEQDTIETYGTEKHAARMMALQKSNALNNNLLAWVEEQQSIRIERWNYSEGPSLVSVWTNLDDEDTPSGKAPTTIDALIMAKQHQEGL